MKDFSDALALAEGLSLRFVRPSDQDFVFKLFIETRPWLAWAEGKPDFIRDLYERQFKVTRSGLEKTYPDHLDFIIDKLGTPVGRTVIDLGYTDWRISELQILKAARGGGLGSAVLRGLQAAAANGNIPLTLSTPVFGSNGFAIYQRLGFQVIQVQQPMIHMVWLPPAIASATAGH